MRLFVPSAPPSKSLVHKRPSLLLTANCRFVLHVWQKKAGATRFALNSSLGASRNGNFYLRTKAEAESGIRGIAYPYFAIARPSLIDAKREPSRPAESASMIAARVLKPLMPRRNRAVTPDRIARALIECVLAEAPGEHIVESGQLQP
jgi:uncharacterized protein YbjT (DUF2867 family)